LRREPGCACAALSVILYSAHEDVEAGRKNQDN
jgi:hypothetical protein